MIFDSSADFLKHTRYFRHILRGMMFHAAINGRHLIRRAHCPRKQSQVTNHEQTAGKYKQSH
ncbi:hypothetical protein BN1221_04802 [Brenneria goodwinii]|uniref:Uncharacterized protein n=1 Tax=Brenneria goodwinii TaxID=1109412 RepID=A0A0G4K260_9GAMM|nr:hypothetical protein BN1221_04802 [Brenneria goodwinii]